MALEIIEAAEKRGEISPDKTTLVEFTSGNTGVAMAAFAAAKGYKFKIGLQNGVSVERLKLLQAYQADIADVPQELIAGVFEKGIAALKKEWGAEYDANIAVAQQAVRDVASKTGFTEEELNKIESVLGTDKSTKLFYAIGAAQGGVKNLQNYNAGQETPEIAKYKLNELLRDKETASLLAKKDHKTMAEIKRLTELSMKG
jgi:LysM repeat protein